MAKRNIELNIFVGEIDNNKIINQKSFNGKINLIIDFINKEFSQRYLKLKDENKIVFNINPEDDVDLQDNWLTLQELVHGGIFTLEEE